MPDSPTLFLCLIKDDKAGHYTQLYGLAQALSEHYQVDLKWINTEDGLWRCCSALVKFASACKNKTKTDQNVTALVSGAGGDTWKLLVFAKKILKLNTLVLLRPRFWPRRWFDLIAAPRHDGLVERDRIICTEGVLNPMLPADNPDSQQGLILIGGPSRHHGWNELQLLDQLRAILRTDSEGSVSKTLPCNWKITTSRRTPENFLPKLMALQSENVEVIPVDATPPNFVQEHLLTSSVVWVTEDSMSMIYEGLTAGIHVGLLSMQRLKQGRISDSIDGLIERRWVTPFDYFQQNKKMYSKVAPLQESRRVADFVFAHLRKRGASR